MKNWFFSNILYTHTYTCLYTYIHMYILHIMYIVSMYPYVCTRYIREDGFFLRFSTNTHSLHNLYTLIDFSFFFLPFVSNCVFHLRWFHIQIIFFLFLHLLFHISTKNTLGIHTQQQTSYIIITHIIQRLLFIIIIHYSVF